MDLSVRVLGSTIATQLRERSSAAVLRIGRDSFTRGDLAGVACFNFTAAANLSAILSRELKGGVRVRDTRDVFDMVPPQVLALPRLGAVSLAVLGAAFEAKGLGGDAPLETWVRKHLGKDTPLVTFASMKHRDEAERADERRRMKARKAQRRDQAHTTRLDRFAARDAAADTTN